MNDEQKSIVKKMLSTFLPLLASVNHINKLMLELTQTQPSVKGNDLELLKKFAEELALFVKKATIAQDTLHMLYVAEKLQREMEEKNEETTMSGVLNYSI